MPFTTPKAMSQKPKNRLSCPSCSMYLMEYTVIRGHSTATMVP